MLQTKSKKLCLLVNQLKNVMTLTQLMSNLYSSKIFETYLKGSKGSSNFEIKMAESCKSGACEDFIVLWFDNFLFEPSYLVLFSFFMPFQQFFRFRYHHDRLHNSDNNKIFGNFALCPWEQPRKLSILDNQKNYKFSF